MTLCHQYSSHANSNTSTTSSTLTCPHRRRALRLQNWSCHQVSRTRRHCRHVWRPRNVTQPAARSCQKWACLHLRTRGRSRRESSGIIASAVSRLSFSLLQVEHERNSMIPAFSLSLSASQYRPWTAFSPSSPETVILCIPNLPQSPTCYRAANAYMARPECCSIICMSIIGNRLIPRTHHSPSFPVAIHLQSRFLPFPITPSHRTRFSTLRLFPAGHLYHVCSLFTPSPFNPLRSHPSRALCICEIVHPNPPTTHLYHHMYLVSSLLCLPGLQPVCI